MALIIPKIKMPDDHDFHFIHVYWDGDAFWEEEDQCFKELGKAIEIPDDRGDLIDKKKLKKLVESWSACHTAIFSFSDFLKLIDEVPVVVEASS